MFGFSLPISKPYTRSPLWAVCHGGWGEPGAQAGGGRAASEGGGEGERASEAKPDGASERGREGERASERGERGRGR